MKELVPKKNKVNQKAVYSLFSLKDDNDFEDWLADWQEKNINPKYKNWQEFRYRESIAIRFNKKSISKEEEFIFLTFLRELNSQKTPVKTINNDFFHWQELPRFRYFFDEFTKNFGIYKNIKTLSEAKKAEARKNIFTGIIEEAIASSQIEGAVITRAEGKKLLQSDRKAKNISEKMVLNNYKTILKIEQEWKNQEMSEDLLLKIQSSLTQDTLKNSGDVGRFRNDDDKIVVADSTTGETIFEPSKSKKMKKELKDFVSFANDQMFTKTFFSEPAKAILLHFWLAYLHPFCDGNGRTARAVFYWYLLRKNYLHIGFLPISTRIQKSKTAYGQAFLLTEHDNNNLTYFFDYMIKQISLAIKDFEEYETKQKMLKNRKIDFLIKNPELNERQVALLEYVSRKPSSLIKITNHQIYYGITYPTAHSDIHKLLKLGFLSSQKRGKTIYFLATDKIKSFL